MNRWRAAFGLGLLLATTHPASAQFYLVGGNKIQYRRLDWQILSGPHVDVYWYPEEASLAPVALSEAEESYEVLARKFSHTVTARIPLVVYASHSDFEQTNILPFVPPEGLLGVTDFLKRRVTLPFRGNVAEFRHTLRHEMVHAFQISLLADRYDRSPRSAGIPIPLWFTEGLAEYWSAGEDARDEMILRDLVYSGRLPALPDLEYVTSGIVYPLGGRIHRWLGETYGDWRVAMLYRDFWQYESFSAAVEGIYGRTLEKLGEEFQVAMRQAYYPSIESRASLPSLATLLARGAIKPTFAPGDSAGDEVIYASAGNGYVEYTAQPVDGGDPTTVLRSSRSAGFENFHAFESRPDASRPGLLLFSTRHHNRDAIMIYDRERREVVGRYQFPGIVSVISPIWGAGGREIIFSGLGKDGVSNLYRVQLPGGSLDSLTADIYQDLDPSLSPDGTRLVFASDRTAGGPDGAVNLFLLDLRTGAIRQLTSGPWIDETPRWVDPDRIVFTSSRDGILNVFSVDTSGMGRRETSVWTGAFDAAPVPGRDAWLVGGFDHLTLGIYLYPGDSTARADPFVAAAQEPEPAGQWTWPVADQIATTTGPGRPYRRKYAVDFAAGEFAYVPRVATGQAATVVASDLLSDNLFFVSITTYQGQQVSNLYENISLQGLYLNQTRRLNWGVGAFRFRGNQYVGDFAAAYVEKSVGTFGMLRYPLNRFARVEGQMVVEHSDRIDFTLPVDEPRRVGWIVSHYASFIHDNSLWTTAGPIDGHHLALTVGEATDFTNVRFDSYTAAADARQYFRLGRQSAFAVRGLVFWSGGDRPERINIGGTIALRGYPDFGYIIGSRAWMTNAEVRFPLLNYVVVGTPLTPLNFPEIQGALFVDLGRTWYPNSDHRALLGSFGSSFRWPVIAGLVLRLDWGRRFTNGKYPGYGLSPADATGGFVHFFFGYNY